MNSAALLDPRITAHSHPAVVLVTIMSVIESFEALCEGDRGVNQLRSEINGCFVTLIIFVLMFLLFTVEGFDSSLYLLVFD